LIAVQTETTILGSCFFCGKIRRVFYSEKHSGYYCEKCLLKTPDNEDIKIYEPVEKTGRRVTYTHKGKILKIEDF
jgi:hypothetical protein